MTKTFWHPHPGGGTPAHAPLSAIEANMRNNLLVLLIVLATFTSATFAVSIDNVKTEIAEKARVERLQVREENGTIILEGISPTLWDKAEAEKIASKKLKRTVVNNIGISGARKTDQEITLDILARIHRELPNNDVFNLFSVETHNGEVLLRGNLRDAYLKDVAVKSAMKTPGAVRVIDRIELLPVSPGDDRLRLAVLARLASDGRLSAYFASLHPAISIIVKNSRVTLAGYVDNQLDKERADLLAGETPGVMSVYNQLQIR